MKYKVPNFKRIIFSVAVFLIFLLFFLLTREKEPKLESDLNNSHEVLIYSIDGCPYCEKALKFLKDRHLQFVIIDITFDDRVWQRLKEETGSATVPYIFIDGEYIGGCLDMLSLSESGKLSEILK
ncbi:MAG: glutathione S-transferase N-terminal domain-containing protein [Rickettsiaceae bacterium]|nr:glutathione S-transferase N-terminal domain-containing protein [Rickettsiaceae bacterium]